MYSANCIIMNTKYYIPVITADEKINPYKSTLLFIHFSVKKLSREELNFKYVEIKRNRTSLLLNSSS
jgi:hypothetical protein